jgi:hypothetical protein
LMHHDLNQQISLLPGARLDIQWVDHLWRSKSKAILPFCPDLTIFFRCIIAELGRGLWWRYNTRPLASGW